MSKKYKIYILSDPNTGEIKYIGQTSINIILRLAYHIKEAFSNRNSNKEKNDYIILLAENNKIPIINIIEDDLPSKNIANQREIYWIKYYRDLGFNLLNKTDGGNTISENNKKLCSKRQKTEWGINQLNEARKKRKFKPLTEEQKEKKKDYWDNLSDERKEEIKQKKKEEYKNLSEQEKERRRQIVKNQPKDEKGRFIKKNNPPLVKVD